MRIRAIMFKNAFRSIFWHGTSIKNLNKILKVGLIPDRKKKQYDRWSGDGFKSIKTYGGVYLASVFRTAFGYAGFASGNANERLLVACTLESRSPAALGDEDDLSMFLVRVTRVQHSGEISNAIEGLSWEKNLFNWVNKVKQADLKFYVDKYIDSCLEIYPRFKERYSRIDKHYFRELVERYIKLYFYHLKESDISHRQQKPKEAPSYLKNKRLGLGDKLRDLDREFENEIIGQVPPELKNTWPRLVKYTELISKQIPEMKDTPSKDYNLGGLDKIRFMEPITYRGGNKIIAVVGHKTEKNEETGYYDNYFTFYYGANQWREILKQAKGSGMLGIGDLIIQDRSGRVLHKEEEPRPVRELTTASRKRSSSYFPEATKPFAYPKNADLPQSGRLFIGKSPTQVFFLNYSFYQEGNFWYLQTEPEIYKIQNNKKFIGQVFKPERHPEAKFLWERIQISFKGPFKDIGSLYSAISSLAMRSPHGTRDVLSLGSSTYKLPSGVEIRFQPSGLKQASQGLTNMRKKISNLNLSDELQAVLKSDPDDLDLELYGLSTEYYYQPSAAELEYIFKEVVDTDDSSFESAIANLLGKKNVPISILKRFAKGSHLSWRRAVALNPETPEALLKYFLDKSIYTNPSHMRVIYAALLKNPSLPKELERQARALFNQKPLEELETPQDVLNLNYAELVSLASNRLNSGKDFKTPEWVLKVILDHPEIYGYETIRNNILHRNPHLESYTGKNAQNRKISRFSKFANPTSLAQLNAIKSSLAEAAQAVYDEWDQDEDGYDEEFGSGGICDAIAGKMADVVQRRTSLDAMTLHNSEIDHTFVLAYKYSEDPEECELYQVDIPYQVYETGGYYNFKKIPDVEMDASDVVIRDWTHMWDDFFDEHGEALEF